MLLSATTQEPGMDPQIFKVAPPLLQLHPIDEAVRYLNQKLKEIYAAQSRNEALKFMCELFDSLEIYVPIINTESFSEMVERKLKELSRESGFGVERANYFMYKIFNKPLSTDN